jgi:tetratricopeptide (TPR) repeat protein
MANDNWTKYKTSGEQALTRGALVEAESMWLAALEEAEDFPEDDSRRAVTYEGLSEAYFRQGKNKDAEISCRRLLSLYRRVHGPDHIDVGITSSNLAMLLHMSHNFADAEPLYKQSIAIKTKVLGANHPDVMRLLEGYADLLLKTHREAEARHLQVCAQGMSTGKWDRTKMELPAMRTSGAASQPAQVIHNSHAHQQPGAHSSQVQQQKEAHSSQAHQQQNSEPTGQRAPKAPAAANPPPIVAPSAPSANLNEHGKASPINWFVYKEFAEEALRRGLMQVAETQWRAALLEAETHQLDKQKLAYALDSLADILCRIKKYQEAEELMTRCIGLKTEALGQLHPLVAMSVSTLARLYYLQKNYLMAETLMGDCIEIYEKGLGDHTETASALYNFAMIYHQQMKLQEAESVYRKCWEMRKRMLGPEHPDTKKVFDNYAKILGAKKPVLPIKPLQQPIKPQQPQQPEVATAPTKLSYSEQAITGSWKILELPDTMRLNPEDK